jgi:hypothetical protein
MAGPIVSIMMPTDTIRAWAAERMSWAFPLAPGCAVESTAEGVRATWRAVQLESRQDAEVGDLLPGDEFHRQEGNAVGLLHRKDRDDVGMIERGDVLGLAGKPGAALRVGSFAFEQDFQRDVAIELGVARAIDLAHAAFADFGDNLVLRDDCLGGNGVGHIYCLIDSSVH